MKVNELNKDKFFPLVYKFSQEMPGLMNLKKRSIHEKNEAKNFCRKFYKHICKL
jgi:hypothetical protein